MILNRTNSKAIEKVAGSGLVQDWVGTQVTLYVEKGVKAFGEVVDALRIRDKKPSKVKMDEEIFKQMEFAIEGGKHVQVENAMSKYIMTKEQIGSLEGLIFKKKKK